MNYDIAKELFEVTYEGVVVNKVRRNYKTVVGKRAGSIDSGGYSQIWYKGKIYFAHNISWLLTFKQWPANHLDHINGDPQDNAITNLREVTRSQNQQNAKRRVDNTVGVKGITFKKDLQRYTARVQTENSRKYIGAFKTLDEAKLAIEAYRAATHKEFANHG